MELRCQFAAHPKRPLDMLMLVYRINHEAKRVEHLGPDGVWQLSQIKREHNPTRVYRFVRPRLRRTWPELLKTLVQMQNAARFSYGELRELERAARKKIRNLDARTERLDRNRKRAAKGGAQVGSGA
jgi:hypothetical protein